MLDLILLLLIALGIYWAIRTLRRNEGHPCSQCAQSCQGCHKERPCK